MSAAWLNPAGGLRYHVRALLSGSDWQPFRSALARWLELFEPSAARVVLVGPSAGYTLPDAFLSRFSAITVLEPDPIARFLLGRRLHRLRIAPLHFERADRLISPLLDGGEGLAELLRADPALCPIFSNVLGQTRFLLEDPGFERFKLAFRECIAPLLVGRAWLSFHDRLSGQLAPNFVQPYTAQTRLDDRAVLRELYSSAAGSAVVELFDHQSDGFFPAHHPHAYFHWRIDSVSNHLIEGVMSSGR